MSEMKTFGELSNALWNSCCNEALPENNCYQVFLKKSSNFWQLINK